jgi:hypothetical protein
LTNPLPPDAPKRLPQVTAQCRESQTGEFMPLFEKVLKSYTPPAKA